MAGLRGGCQVEAQAAHRQQLMGRLPRKVGQATCHVLSMCYLPRASLLFGPEEDQRASTGQNEETTGEVGVFRPGSWCLSLG